MDVVEQSGQRMQKSIDVLKNEMATLRAGRANPRLLDRLTVEAYGTPTPVAQVANVSAPEPRMLVISPWDPKMISIIEKAIQTSDLGINPTNDGKIIRLVIPELTTERRRDLVKGLHKMGEDCKIAMRAIRRDGMEHVKKLKKDGEYTEDDVKDDETALQKVLDKAMEQCDKLLAEKEKEIMTL